MSQVLSQFFEQQRSAIDQVVRVTFRMERRRHAGWLGAVPAQAAAGRRRTSRPEAGAPAVARGANGTPYPRRRRRFRGAGAASSALRFTRVANDCHWRNAST